MLNRVSGSHITPGKLTFVERLSNTDKKAGREQPQTAYRHSFLVLKSRSSPGLIIINIHTLHKTLVLVCPQACRPLEKEYDDESTKL